MFKILSTAYVTLCGTVLAWVGQEMSVPVFTHHGGWERNKSPSCQQCVCACLELKSVELGYLVRSSRVQ